ncbi:acetyltransferase [Halobacillus andaensis]|uniref:Acetyltransferase n=1 Tax=Halobacillus andaensis TaxID=1176239 RepID=A0A917B1Y3_HALAA|nr:GNAT family N-acetyltransferase [Halobacillus andaensis]MBP2003912.1 GNAT superfamily N-acetyltransferase [Halobacillus andaensis]GGF14256.1 acetyltransferase [Halobacillus andaensis]
MITFNNIHRIGHHIYENETYHHYHYPEMLVRYDSNFLQFKKVPTLEEFKEAYSYLRDFHLSKGQKHVKFYLPENEKPDKQLMNYLKDHSFEVGFLELYKIQPKDFPEAAPQADIKLELISEKNLSTFLRLHYEQDVAFGIDFADQKIDLNRRLFHDPSIEMVLAYFNGEPAGSVTLIHTEHTVEIDHLVVEDKFQRKGIGTELQRFVMKRNLHKTVILVADGEDTARNMYRKQNYECIGVQYEIQKID